MPFHRTQIKKKELAPGADHPVAFGLQVLQGTYGLKAHRWGNLYCAVGSGLTVSVRNKPLFLSGFFPTLSSLLCWLDVDVDRSSYQREHAGWCSFMLLVWARITACFMRKPLRWWQCVDLEGKLGKSVVMLYSAVLSSVICQVKHGSSPSMVPARLCTALQTGFLLCMIGKTDVKDS